MKPRPAFSLVEVLVAVVVFTIAALGSAGALALSARAQLNAAARREALAALQSQAAEFVSAPCALPGNGERLVGSIRVAWTVEATDSLSLITLAAAHRGTLTSLRTEVACE